MDLISRELAIDAIKTWGLIDGLAEGQAIEILADEEKLPSEQRWIPCSERLPKKGTKVILFYSNGKISGGVYLGERTWDIDYADVDLKVSVIAWMPLPEPARQD